MSDEIVIIGMGAFFEGKHDIPGFVFTKVPESRFGFDGSSIVDAVLISTALSATYDIIKIGLLKLKNEIKNRLQEKESSISVHIRGIIYIIESEQNLDIIFDQIDSMLKDGG